MNRTKITISLSKKALKIIDKYATSTGFESRSRVIDEAIFTITNLLALKTSYEQKIQSTMMKTNSSQPEAPLNIFMLMDTLSKWGGILETFERFPDDTKTQTPIEHNRKIYRKASIDRSHPKTDGEREK